ncbi:MAG: Nif3-like dinuclear metal center hexameric protein [Clostridia bacterium]|nr:Nif3-like dinuclear metal center hexameric protein [Clostridia bacterium]
MKIKEIYEFLDSVAPYNTQCEWDNSGFMCGEMNKDVTSVMLCLDCTNDVIEQATENGCNLIICHHPLIFSPVKRVYGETPLYNAIKNDITVISAHTNLDMADGGVNDVLSKILGLTDCEKLFAEGAPFMRMGNVKEQSATDFSSFVAKKLGNGAEVYDSGRIVNKVAVCGGAGGEYIPEAFYAGCDTFVTGEAKHHERLEAGRLGINLIVAGHFSTEVPVIKKLSEKLKEAFPDTEVYIASEESPCKTVV